MARLGERSPGAFGPWFVALVVVLALVSVPGAPLSRLLPIPVAAQPTSGHVNWNVTAGSSPGQDDQSIQGMGFFPGLITIDQYDTITWRLGSFEPHTISFVSGAVPPATDSPTAIKPSGGSVYNGTGFVSSGVIFPTQTYTLNFTRPGVYQYFCLTHIGMAGIVVVNPVGTPYPYTQAQYNVQAKAEVQSDIAAEDAAMKLYQPVVEPGPNGTSTYIVATSLSPIIVNVTYTSAGIPSYDVLPGYGPPTTTVPLTGVNGATPDGSATVILPHQGALQVKLSLSGLSPNGVYSAQLRFGTCSVQSRTLYPLNNIDADSAGKGTSTTSITDYDMNLPNIPQVGWFIDVYQGQATTGTPAACGNISYPTVALMRFIPGTFTVKAGDTVEWVQHSPNDEHDVTFSSSSNVVVENPGAEDISAEAAPASAAAQAAVGGIFILDAGGEDAPSAGNATNFNDSKFYSSGPLAIGEKFVLTFPTPGAYEYVCEPHDALGMIGFLNVVPATQAVSPAAEGFTTLATVQQTSTATAASSPTAAPAASGVTLSMLGAVGALVVLGLVFLFVAMRRRR